MLLVLAWWLRTTYDYLERTPAVFSLFGLRPPPPGFCSHGTTTPKGNLALLLIVFFVWIVVLPRELRLAVLRMARCGVVCIA